MTNQLLQSATEHAITACDEAASVVERFLRSGDWSVSNKPDNTPVTEVDVAAEEAIKKVLMAAKIDAEFYGEETGRTAANTAKPSKDSLLWLVDPIDGTKSFVRQSPFYSSQIALMQGDELVVGVSNAPAYGERLVATKGAGVELNGKAVRCNAEVNLKEAYLSTGNLTTLASNPTQWQALATLVSQVKRTRGYGDFCHYHQLCCGQADIVVESDVNILDIAALTVAVREAGGVITDLSGNAITQDTTSVLAAANAPLHSAVLAILSA